MQTYQVSQEPTIIVIDGAHMLRRATYQPKLRELTNSRGVPSGGVFGFVQSLKSVCAQFSASSAVVTWEGGHSERRKGVYSDYKVRAYEEEPARDLNGYTDYEFYNHQLSWVKKLLESLGVPQVMVDGKEGDDVLFQVVHLLRGNKVIVSEDSDFYSLINESVSVYRPIKKSYIDLVNFQEMTEVPSPLHYLYLKSIVGDSSDNIPSVAKGVGWKTAADVLNLIEEKDLNPARIIKEAASFGKARYNKIVEAGVPALERNLNLIDISREPFDIFQLQQIMDELNSKRYPNQGMALRIMNFLEFNDTTVNYIWNKMSALGIFPLANLTDKTYIKSVLTGNLIL